MTLLDLMKTRRSIRKYTKQEVEDEKLEQIMEAGLYAPNPGGRQGTKIIILDDPDLIHQIGIMNANAENRDWGGLGVSSDQPSIIDDLSIKSGFYKCPALAIVCVKKENKDQVNAIGSAFVCAQNMVLEAYDLGISSCIVGRAEATYHQEAFQKIWKTWQIDEAYMPMVFVCLGYIEGNYPQIKPRNEGRAIYIHTKAQ